MVTWSLDLVQKDFDVNDGLNIELVNSDRMIYVCMPCALVLVLELDIKNEKRDAKK